MLRWFEPDEENWRVRPELAEIVRFGRANLLDEPTDEMRFDVIFCRNVLTIWSRRAAPGCWTAGAPPGRRRLSVPGPG